MPYPLKQEKEHKFTWQEYLRLPSDERWEAINGEAYNMSPSPTSGHQIVVGNFYRLLSNKITSPCRVFIAPLDVYLDDYNFVQPDVFVVCDRSKIRDRIYGAPDLIIEVLSFFTAIRDRRLKKDLYERFGVREYIIVHPEEQYIERFFLTVTSPLSQETKYSEPEIFGPDEVFTSKAFDGLEIPLWEIFEIEKKD